MAIEKSRKQVSMALERVEIAAEHYRDRHKEMVRAYSGFFDMADARRSTAVRGMFEAQMDNALAEILRNGGNGTVFGPHPSMAYSGSTLENISEATGLKISDIKRFYSRADKGLGSLTADVDVAVAQQAIAIVDGAFAMLLTRAAVAFEDAERRMSGARSGRAVRKISDEESRQTRAVMEKMAQLCDYIGSGSMARPQIVLDIVHSGSGIGLIQHIQRTLEQERRA